MTPTHSAPVSPRIPKSHHTMKTRDKLLADIDAAILAAPPENPDALKERNSKIRKSKNPDGNTREAEDYRSKVNRAELVAIHLKGDHGKITITAGPVSYTVWNTRENLELFRARVARSFPKNTR
jgi:hypothetical protein